MPSMLIEKSQHILQKTFGYDSFRGLQKDILSSIYEGNDTLVIMPTGGGKSLCYQIPALAQEGVTFVISPLISLMKDQVDQLQELGIAATFLNSSISPAELRERLINIHSLQYKLVYIAPERLESDHFKRLFAKLAEMEKINLVAVDEAHCISQWGHDFRPSYKNIVHMRKLSTSPFLALTATATERVKEDIVQQLQLKNVQSFIGSFDRKNLHYKTFEPHDKLGAITSLLKNKKDQSGIIYCGTRKHVEKVADFLNHQGFTAGKYHAGLSDKERKKVQDQFITDKTPIVVATNAFGMGIDKPNVRFVIHYDMPGSLESYTQEAGRAGRDGEESECSLLFSNADVFLQRFFIDMNNPPDEPNEKRRHAEAKLQDMINYVESNNCKRNTIQHYFGFEKVSCDKCICCVIPEGTSKCKEDVTDVAHHILKGLASFPKNFGMSLTAAILSGSESKNVKKWQADQWEAHNTLKGYGQSTLIKLIKQLLKKGLIERSNGEFPTISISERGRKSLLEDSSIIVETQSIFESPSTPSQDSSIDQKLFSQLRNFRTHEAAERGVPPYLIFGDRTLREICSFFPQTLEQLQQISGMGEKKIERYGGGMLNIITPHCEKMKLSFSPPSRASNQKTHFKKKTQLPTGGTRSETLRLLQKNLSLAEIATQRNLKLSTIESHVADLINTGKIADISPFVGDEEKTTILNAISQAKGKGITPIKMIAGEEISYGQIRMVLAERSKQ